MCTETNTTTWLSGLNIPKAAKLEGKDTADVAVIGGGIAGTLSAYLLGNAGKKVVILEKKDLSEGATARTTAWLNCAIDTDLVSLAGMHGVSGARKIWNSGQEAINLMEKIIEEENIDCDFKRVSSFIYAASPEELEDLKKEHELARKIGFDTVLHSKKALSWHNQGSLELKNQAKFHPLKFVIGLRKASEKYGVAYYENTEALDIKGRQNLVISTESGEVTARYALIATYNPFNKPKELFAHKGMYISYVFEVQIPKAALPEGLYMDKKNPYHYFRVDSMGENDRLIIGGEDHRKEIPIPPEKNFKALESYLSSLFPSMPYKIIRKWTGPILETIDGLPYIGIYGEDANRLVATGFSGNGMTYSAIAAQLLSDIILEKKNPYRSLYSASRKTHLHDFIQKSFDFTGEFFAGLRNIFK